MTESASTAEIIRSAERLSGPENFFGRFPDAWSGAARLVMKLETRQEYREPGNPSWEKLVEGDLAEAVRMIPESRSVDVPLYESLRHRNVQFTRCRPVSYPLTQYLQWEIGCYDFNAEHGEEILFAASTRVADLIQQYALHDFMVFDDRIAYVHDYDEAGEIQGGWQVDDSNSIAALQELFMTFRSRCQPYKRFLEEMRISSPLA